MKSVEIRTGVALKINIKTFNGDKLHYELLLITKQKKKLRNTFENNMSAYLKLSKTQISRKAQFGGFLVALLSN